MAEAGVDGPNNDGDDSGATPGSTLPREPAEAQQATGVSTEITPTIRAKPCVEKTCARKDKGRLHAVRHGALARFPLDLALLLRS
jgi:hypothetical protein